MIDSTKISLASIHMAAHLHFWFVCPLEHFPVGSADGSSRLLDILPWLKPWDSDVLPSLSRKQITLPLS